MRFRVFSFVLLCLALTMGYQNCAGRVESDFGAEFSSNSVFNLDPSCVNSSHATEVHVDAPILEFSDTSDSLVQNDIFAKKAPLESGTGDDAPINLVIDDSIYDADPTNRAVGDRYKELIEDSIAIWENGIGRDIFNIVDFSKDVANKQSLSSDGYNTIYWNKDSNIGNIVRKSSGFACVSFSRGGEFLEGDIVINDFHNESNIVDNRVRFFFDCFEDCAVSNSPIQELFDMYLSSFQDKFSGSDVRYRAVHFVSVMAHELGHLLVGSVHTDKTSTSIMKPVVTSYEVTERLSQDDIDLYNSRKKAVRLLKKNVL